MIATTTTLLRWLATAGVIADLLLLVIYYALRAYRAWLAE